MPAYSTLEIANAALVKVGAALIHSFDDDHKTAGIVRERHKKCIWFVLAQHPWACARHTVKLGRDSNIQPVFRANRFTLPTDLVRPLSFFDKEKNRLRTIEIEGTYAFTDQTDVIYLRYLRDIVGTIPVPDELAEVMSLYLAWDIADAITGDSGKKHMLWEAFRQALIQAKINDRAPVWQDTYLDEDMIGEMSYIKSRFHA